MGNRRAAQAGVGAGAGAGAGGYILEGNKGKKCMMKDA